MKLLLSLFVFLLLRWSTSFIIDPPNYRVCLKLDQSSTNCAPYSSLNFSGTDFPLYGFNQSEFNRVGQEAASRPYLPFQIQVTWPAGYEVDPSLVKSNPEVVFDSQGFSYSAHNNPYSNYLQLGQQPTDGNYSHLARLAINILSLVVLLWILILLKPVWSWAFVPLLIVAARGTQLPFDLLLPFYLVFARSKRYLFSFALCFLIFAAASATRYGCYSCLNILPGGSDALTYESFAREIYLQGSFWAAGEPGKAFYYTPLYRYFLSLFHLLGGQSLWPVRFFGNLIYLTTLVAVSRIFLKFFSSKTTVVSLLFLGLLNKLPQLGLYFVFQEYYSESIGLPLLIFSIYFLLVRPLKTGTIFLSGFLLSLAIGVRPNYLFATLPLFIYLLMRAQQKITAGLFFVIGVALPVSFILIRNFIITGQLQYFNTSAASTLAIGLVDLFYHGQAISAPQNLYLQIIQQTFSNPPSTLVPIFNNFLIMVGLPSFLPQTLDFLPVYRPIPNAFVYLPIWLLGVPALVKRIISTKDLTLASFSAVFVLIFFSSLPFGVYFNGSAKYYLYILFLTPFAVESLVGPRRTS